MLKGGSLSASISFGPESRRFDIDLLREGNKYFVALTKVISPLDEYDAKIEFPVNHLHTYQLRYDHTAKTAALWVDGEPMAKGYRGHEQFVEDIGLFFGSYRYSTQTGIGLFENIRFEAH